MGKRKLSTVKKENGETALPKITSKNVKKTKAAIKRKKLPKPEELRQLREVENVFNSNLFRLELEQTLNVIDVKEPTYATILAWLDGLKECLSKLENSVFIKLSEDIANVLPSIKYPGCDSSNVSGVFQFIKPEVIVPFGSLRSGCLAKYNKFADIAIEMPKEVFHKKDYSNGRYLRKRNFYLCFVANLLLKCPQLASGVKFYKVNGDESALLVQPVGNNFKGFQIFLHVFPQRGALKESHLLPSEKNLHADVKSEERLPTPFYNALLCNDASALANDEYSSSVFNKNSNLKEAFKMMCLWMKKRRLNEGLGAFKSHILAMFMAFLFKRKRLNEFMSSYQVMRNVWVALAESQWDSKGISLKDDMEEEAMKTFRKFYPVVFIDATGCANLTNSMFLATYARAKRESKYALEHLDAQEGFFALFFKEVSFIREYDHIIQMDDIDQLEEIVKNRHSSQEIADKGNHCCRIFCETIVDLLKKCLGERVSEVTVEANPYHSEWCVSAERRRNETTGMAIGLKLNPEKYGERLEIGPLANDAEAETFRKLWGENAKLVAHPDGSIRETVVWCQQDATARELRLIPKKIALMRFSQCAYSCYAADQMEFLIRNRQADSLKLPYGTGEEATLAVWEAFNKLSKALKMVDDDLPLPIVSMQGISPVFRHTDPFPPFCSFSQSANGTDVRKNYAVFKAEAAVPPPVYVTPMEVVIKLASSNKWPDSLKAIRKLQAAFYVELGAILKRRFGYVCRPYIRHLDVCKGPHVFRLKIHYPGEIGALKKKVTPEGVVYYEDGPESRAMERIFLQMPPLTSALKGLHHRFPAYGPTCGMTKRWLRGQFLDQGHISDICVDLLVARLFLKPSPYAVAQQPQTMFFRFLDSLLDTDWFVDVVALDLNGELNAEDVAAVEEKMRQDRSSLPALVIVTPYDKSGKSLTLNGLPTFTILARMAILAKATLNVIELNFSDSEADFQELLRHPLKGYNVLIWLKPGSNPRKSATVEIDASLVLSETSKLIPIVGFDPIQSYLKELRENFDDICLFFHDTYGGEVIAVLFKPDIFDGKELKVKNMNGVLSKGKNVRLNKRAILNDFRLMGEGLVDHVERQ